MHRTYYNRRTRNLSTGEWSWQYPYSPAVIDYPAPSSAGPASVFYSSTGKYGGDPANPAKLYKYLMYQVYQPGTCDSIIAGFLYYSLSDNGICWTAPQKVGRADGTGPSFDCLKDANGNNIPNTLPIEQAAAIDGGSTLYLVGVEGDIQQLAPPVSERDTDNWTPRRYNLMNRTQTYLGFANPANPAVLTLAASPELSTNGMFIPNYGPNNAMTHETRYKGYAYFMNLHIAWDAASGNFYIGRAYPYPFDRGSGEAVGWYDPPTENNTPLNSQVSTCRDSPYTLPNRIQIYRMNIGSLSNIGQIATGTWTLVTDLGGPVGYGFDTIFPMSTAPLIPGQTNAGRDYGAVSFLRNRSGNLMRYSGTAYYFPADTFVQSKASGPCLVTGNERIFLRTLP